MPPPIGRGERALDADEVFAEAVDGLVGQPVVELLEGLLAGEDLHPGDLLLAAVGLLDRGVEHRRDARQMSRPGAVAFDERNDRVVRHRSLPFLMVILSPAGGAMAVLLLRKGRRKGGGY